MKIFCPDVKCKTDQNHNPKINPIVGNGSFFRRSDSKWITRYHCRNCGKYFSASTRHPAYYQKRRRITRPLKLLVCSGVSQRRAAVILGVNPKTVVRRFRFIAHQERARHQKWMNENFGSQHLSHIQFDDLETAEHTKCKPISVSLAVDPRTRKILNFKVSQMPAKGLLAKTALRKYGLREDQRPRGWDQMMKELVPFVSGNVVWHSDDNPHYPRFVFKHFPHSQHKTVKGGRGAISGQGELKKLRFDPLFSLNHTCAMLRANLNRLFRRTWCITKNQQGLIDHLSIYVSYHNQVLTSSSAVLGGSY